MTNEQLSSKVAELSNVGWSIADGLWTQYSKGEIRDFILPMMVLRRLDCLLEKTKPAVLEQFTKLPKDVNQAMADRLLRRAAGLDINLYNTSQFTFEQIRAQGSEYLYELLIDYINGFPEFLQVVFNEHFEFPTKIQKLRKGDRLWRVFDKMCALDLHPDRISNLVMGYAFEDLVRRFNEAMAVEAGDHYTPREAIRLMAKILVRGDIDAITRSGVIRTIYDGACGTGGMLTVAEEELRETNPNIKVELYGQQLRGDTFAVCVTDMLLKGQDPTRIKKGDTLEKDLHAGQKFHYCMANPPYGVDWDDAKQAVDAEHHNLGFNGRFGAGLPRKSDGQLLFLQHFANKMRDDEQGGRCAIVLNGSPLFTGAAGSGESEIRKWLLEKDLVEGIVGLPTDMFYNTGISTYIWILNNRKPQHRHNRVRLLDASSEAFWTPMRKSLGSKRKELKPEAINMIVDLFYSSAPSEYVKDFDTEDFGYSTITVERPLKLKFQVTEERLEILSESKSLDKLSDAEKVSLESTLRQLPEGKVWMDRSEFLKDLKSKLRLIDLSLKAPQEKVIIGIFGEHDEDAIVCKTTKGEIEPNTDLRDSENVPLKEDIQEYFEREIIPHVPDAWIDHSKTKVGYEIPFTRYFYKYLHSRKIEDIDQDLSSLTLEISQLLGVTSQ